MVRNRPINLIAGSTGDSEETLGKQFEIIWQSGMILIFGFYQSIL